MLLLLSLAGSGALWFIPKILRTELLDEVIQVTNEDAGVLARRLGKEEGIFWGGALWAARS